MRVVTIGRKGTDIVLNDSSNGVSRLHADLTITDQGTLYLVDCGSSNGTFVHRQGTWHAIKQDYVTREEQVRFGSQYEIRVSDLLSRAPVE